MVDDILCLNYRDIHKDAAILILRSLFVTFSDISPVSMLGEGSIRKYMLRVPVTPLSHLPQVTLYRKSILFSSVCHAVG